MNPLPIFDPSKLPVSAKGVDVVTLCAFETLFSNFVKVSVYLVGLAAFIAFIGGGIKYLTSGGDPKGTQQAQQTITMAVAGLFILAAAWLILKFIKEFTGVDVTIFSIPECGPISVPAPLPE